MRCCLAWSFATSLWSRVPIRDKINQCYCGGFETFCYRAPKIYPNFRAGAKNNQYHGKLALDRWALLDMPNWHREPEKNLTSSHVERKGPDHFNFTQFITYEKIYNTITSKICLPICSVLHFCLMWDWWTIIVAKEHTGQWNSPPKYYLLYIYLHKKYFMQEVCT